MAKPSHQKRQEEIYLDDEDVLARVLGLAEGDYLCITVNSSWPAKGLLEGDIILFKSNETAGAGDVVLIEEEGQVRLGLVSRPGFLDTIYGRRPLEASERIVAVGSALARRLGEKDTDAT
jgi:hypothetical protein